LALFPEISEGEKVEKLQQWGNYYLVFIWLCNLDDVDYEMMLE